MVQRYYRIRKRKDTGSWEVNFSIDGKRFRKSYRNLKKSQVEQLAEQFVSEKLLGNSATNSKKSDLQTVLTRYMEWARNIRHKKERSIVTDKTSIKQFLHYAPIQNLNEIDEKVISHVIGEMKDDEYSPTTINIMIRCWKSICNRAVEWKSISKNPFASIKQLRIPEKDLKSCSPEQRDEILRCAKRCGRNIHLVCALGFYAGLRKKEISFVQWEWFDFEENLIHVVNTEDFETKSKKNRTVPMLNELKVILQEYKGEKNEGSIFEQVRGTKEYHYYFRKAFESVKKEANLEWITPHTMRHTFASILAQKGAPLYSIGSWLGHSHTRVTELYAHLQAYDINIEKLVSGSVS